MKSMKKYGIVILTFLLMFCAFPVKAKAETIDVTNSTALAMPNASVTGEFTEGNNGPRYFGFTVAQTGYMKVDLMAEYYQRLLLTSSTGESLWSSDMDVNDSGTSHQEKTFYLEPGQYYLGFGALRGIFVVTPPYGKFAFNTSWTPVAVTEYGNNDTLYGANGVALGQSVTGMFTVETEKDKYRDKDFYSINLSASGLYQLKASSAQSYSIGVYNAAGDEKYNGRVNVDSSLGLANFKKDINLPAGKYYIMIEPRSSDEYGTYSLKMGFSDFAPKAPTYAKASKMSTTSAKISWYSSNDAEGYTVYMRKGKSYVPVGSTTKTAYKVKRLKAGTSYIFKVRAYVTVNGQKNYSGYSNTAYYATAPARTSIVKIQRVSPKKSGYGQYYRAKLTWKKSVGATEYKVYARRAGTSYKSLIGTYKRNSASVSQYWGRYSSGSRKYTFYVVPVKKYKGSTYTGSYSRGKTYTFY